MQKKKTRYTHENLGEELSKPKQILMLKAPYKPAS